MGDLVKRVRLLETLLGSGDKGASKSETEIKPSVRRSIVSRRDLPAGHVLAKEDLTWVRPAGGMSPGRESELTGNKLCHAVKAGHQMTMEDIGRSA
jgi:N-acetylneuraminate synthase